MFAWAGIEYSKLAPFRESVVSLLTPIQERGMATEQTREKTRKRRNEALSCSGPYRLVEIAMPEFGSVPDIVVVAAAVVMENIE